MKNILKFSAILGLALFLTACGISKKRCMTEDWQNVGHQDGSIGKLEHNYTKENTKCAEYGVNLIDQYNIGYKAGLSKYCSQDKWAQYGQNQGANGQELSIPPQDYNLCQHHNHHIQTFAQAGHVKGVKTFCAKDNMHNIGASGSAFPKVCRSAENFKQANKSWLGGLDTYCVASRGQEQGIAGNNYNRECQQSRHSEYFAGFEQGNTEYCSHPITAYQTGRQGNSLRVDCPSYLQAEFSAAFARGKSEHDRLANLRSERYSKEGEINKLKYDAGNLDSDISSLRKEVEHYTNNNNGLRSKNNQLNHKMAGYNHEINQSNRKIQELNNKRARESGFGAQHPIGSNGGSGFGAQHPIESNGGSGFGAQHPIQSNQNANIDGEINHINNIINNLKNDIDKANREIAANNDKIYRNENVIRNLLNSRIPEAEHKRLRNQDQSYLAMNQLSDINQRIYMLENAHF